MGRREYLDVLDHLAHLGGDFALRVLRDDLILLVGDRSDGLDADRGAAQEDFEELLRCDEEPAYSFLLMCAEQFFDLDLAFLGGTDLALLRQLED
jgi:hypothetical protein